MNVKIWRYVAVAAVVLALALAGALAVVSRGSDDTHQTTGKTPAALLDPVSKNFFDTEEAVYVVLDEMGCIMNQADGQTPVYHEPTLCLTHDGPMAYGVYERSSLVANDNSYDGLDRILRIDVRNLDKIMFQLPSGMWVRSGEGVDRLEGYTFLQWNVPPVELTSEIQRTEQFFLRYKDASDDMMRIAPSLK